MRNTWPAGPRTITFCASTSNAIKSAGSRNRRMRLTASSPGRRRVVRFWRARPIPTPAAFSSTDRCARNWCWCWRCSNARPGGSRPWIGWSPAACRVRSRAWPGAPARTWRCCCFRSRFSCRCGCGWECSVPQPFQGAGGGGLMDPVVVVGSGASGVHFALGALRKGHRVIMLDVGHSASAPVNPGDTLNGLKRGLNDPAGYFLGPGFRIPDSAGFRRRVLRLSSQQIARLPRAPLLPLPGQGVRPAGVLRHRRIGGGLDRRLLPL